MSKDGEYFSLDGGRLQQVWGDDAGLTAFLDRQRFPSGGSSAPDAPCVLQGIGDAWDVLQRLGTKLGLRDLVGEKFLTKVVNADYCGTIGVDRVGALAVRTLGLLREQKRLVLAINTLDYDKLYHGEQFAKDPDRVFRLFNDVTRLFVLAAGREQGLAFRVG